ncbi:MAG: YggS family pyridoxal phosphate-dependent enzyme [Bacillota bacterium]|nr:YggS family pyridoxal phosphate-dependent enzyme [Bacillota bacterium]
MSILNNIEKILNEIPEEVKLVAVSKTRSIEEIKEAYDYGIRDFGENKVQELISKEEKLNKDIKWHLIGHLQRNKVKYIVGKVYLIHSLDNINLLREIEKEYKKHDLTAKSLIEVNIGREESKTGILAENLEELIFEIEKCENVKILGLMAIIPKGDEIACLNYFKKVKELYDRLSKIKYKNISMKILSMGMTSDYKYAVSEGSNMVRIGEGIFGKRNYNKEG